MSYALIDTVIDAWSVKDVFTVHTQYQDTEVRSVDVVSPKGRKFQIWIDKPTGSTVAVHAWDYKNNRRDWSGPIGQLAEYLEEATRTVRNWTTS